MAHQGTSITNILILDSNEQDIVQTQWILKEVFDSVLIRVFLHGGNLLSFLQSTSMSQSNIPDLIILEIDFPDDEGIRTLQAIRALPAAASIPVLLHTRTWNFNLIEQGFKAGARAIVPKFSPVQLKSQINRILSELQAA
ncbi:MAG: response regulator [Nitrospina sp.]|nr:response regulator [Nitrospina sp.]